MDGSDRGSCVFGQFIQNIQREQRCVYALLFGICQFEQNRHYLFGAPMVTAQSFACHSTHIRRRVGQGFIHVFPGGGGRGGASHQNAHGSPVAHGAVGVMQSASGSSVSASEFKDEASSAVSRIRSSGYRFASCAIS